MRRKSKSDHPSYGFHFLAFTLMMLMTLLLAHKYLLPMNYGKILMLAPAIYFLTESMGALGQFLFSLRHSRTNFLPIHDRPLFSTTLSQFWGRRWNLWVQDWLRDVGQIFGRKPAAIGMIGTFAISGFFHEIMINFPYWLVYGKRYFGTMMFYFIIQSGALWLDKKYIRKCHPIIQRGYLWVVVILPSPIFINVPLLTFLGMKHE